MPHSKGKKPRARGEAIIIKPNEGKTYAEVLTKIRLNAGTDQLNIKSVRRTKNGAVLMELIKDSNNTGALCQRIKEVVGQEGAVKNLIPRQTLEIKDLDSLTTKEEVEDAFKRELNGLAGGIRINLTKANSREQKMAFVEIDERSALELIKVGKIRVGFVIARFGTKINVQRCYRCLGYGHIAKDCEGPERKDACYKCGETSHKAGNCSAEARCFLCAESKVEANRLRHIPGSGGCEVFREALKAARRKCHENSE